MYPWCPELKLKGLDLMTPKTMHNFFLCLILCIFCVIILSKRSSAADYRYEACVPVPCGGVNISFPFYIRGLQEPFCGNPGFRLNCGDSGFPVLELPGNEYVIEGISYENKNFRVYDSAVLSSNSSNCLPGIRNSTFDTQPQFDYVDVTHLRLFGSCPETLTDDLSRYKVDCKSWDLASYDDDIGENLTRIALEDCERNVLVPVNGAGRFGDRNGGIGDVLGILRKGFELNWTAADCATCETSGGHCGFNETSYKFMCFCPDRPHTGSCKPDSRNLIARSLSKDIEPDNSSCAEKKILRWKKLSRKKNLVVSKIKLEAVQLFSLFMSY